MRSKSFKVFSFFLSLFFVISCLDLFASGAENKQAVPLIKVTTEVNEGIVFVFLTAPKHLTISESYRLFSTSEGKGLESVFIFTKMDSENPQCITFSVFAKNTDDGIDCIIDEIQVFEEKGWFSDTLYQQESSQVIHIQNNIVNMAANPEMLIAKKNVFKNSAVVRFSLLPSE